MQQQQNDHNRKYETRDAHFSRVMTTAFGLIGLIAVGMIFSWAVYEIFISTTAVPDSHAETFTVPDPAKLPPGPNLEADPHESLILLRAREDSVLSSYGWVDTARGIARVPIERAMELYLDKGTGK